MSGRFRLLMFLPTILISATAFGSGFALFEQGAKAVAMGGAFAATADDPSAIFYNVAGIAQQRHAEFLAGGTAITFKNSFQGDPNDLFTAGATGKYRRHIFIPPNAYAVMPIGTNMTIGLGVMSPFGLRTNWQEPWLGRFVSKDADIKVVSVEPAIAWQTSDGRVAVGFGPEYRRSHVILSRNTGALNPFNGRFADVASTYLGSKWGSSWGWNAGVLVKPSPNWRIGVSYRAAMTIKFNGTATVTQIPSGNAQFDAVVATQLPPTQAVKTSLAFPSFTHIGIATSAFQGWDIEADIVHTTWSRFKELQVNFLQTPSFSFTQPEKWKNADSYRLGVNRKVNETWDVRVGALYDKNPQPTNVVSPLLPDADRQGATLGVGYHRGPLIIDVTEFALHFKKRSTQGISSENFNGTYKTDANLISLNFGYRF